jgi:membrane glycosyltransferase
MVTVFVLLFFWITIGFWTATFGFVRELITRSVALRQKEAIGTVVSNQQAFPKTAIVMPIYNEDVSGVCTRLQAMYESVEQTGQGSAFDFFILSDSTDPDIGLEEEQAWASLRASLQGGSGFYYRRRTINTGHKSGNIRDFCIHWGLNYRYMVVLDADSLMTGQTFLAMVQKMEQDLEIGILQSLPLPVNRRSLFGRLQQFAAHLYGPIFTSGYTLWSQMEATYWGHNAIIRIQAFMESCGLPTFPGKAPLGGEILSHDFVEAAFILRRGWKVMVDYDLAGSYEECPANLIDFARRDQRWCQGNLQHLRLLFQQGLRMLSRAQLGMGAMSYLSSPIWAAFLLLIALMGLGMNRPGGDHPAASSAIGLFVVTLLLLVLPKVWALFLAMAFPSRLAGFAGAEKATLSVFLEIAVSILMAPILMVFHTTFVVGALFGRSVQWNTQQRADTSLSLKEAFGVHAAHTIAGLAGALLLIWLAPELLVWMVPVLLPLVLSVPISMLLSSQRAGNWLLKHKLLVIPQEVQPPELLERQRVLLRERTAAMRGAPHPFNRVVVIPAFNALHIALLGDQPASAVSERMERLKRVALSGGAGHLSKSERREIISDAAALEWLHREAWRDWPVDLIERCTKTFI